MKTRLQLQEELQRLQEQFDEQVAEYTAANPTESLRDIGLKFGLSNDQACKIARRYGIRRLRGRGSPAFPRRS